jgi:hypothetical protein
MTNHRNRSRRPKTLPADLRKENPSPSDYMFDRVDGRLVVLKESLGAGAASLRYPDLTFLLFKRGAKYKLAACRGQAKSCRVIGRERQKLGPCADCIELDNENTTLGELYDRMQKGDA